MPALPKCNWSEVRTAYVHEEPAPSLIDLATRFGVTHSTMRKHSSQGNWPDARKRARRRVAQFIDKKETNKRAATYVEWDDKHLKGAEALYVVAMKELAVLLAIQMQRGELKGLAVDKLAALPKIPSGKVTQLARVLLDVVNIERKVHGRDMNLDDPESLKDFSPERAQEIVEWVDEQYRRNGGIQFEPEAKA